MNSLYKLMCCMVVGSTMLMSSCSEPDNSLFRLISPSESGVNFENKLDYEDDSLTILDFEYKYNGAGVSIGDVNNDGLPDLYFTGNMVSSRLYINQGDLKFKDVTEAAGVGTNVWANGSSMVDINQDGLLDIYVCQAGHRFQPDSIRKNLLFINQGGNTFLEEAAKYGLDDPGYSVQSVFFDYDRDGDLDMYLLQNGLVSFNRNTPREIIRNGRPPYTDDLYRNNGDGTFTNVSDEAGIMVEGFGLGVEVCDLNNDHWPDIYVSNDFLTNDLVYINNKNGTFTESARKLLKHQTLNGMGNDVTDINNDGWQDIMVLDMLPEDNKQWKLTMMGNNYDVFKLRDHYGYQPQYMRNTLQLNNKDGSFSEIGQLSGVNATDWSWSVLFADYDNNGLKDPFITNGYRQNITDLDFITYSRSNASFGNHEQFRNERIKMLKEIEGVKRHNYIYENNGDLTFTDRSLVWGMDKPTYSNGAAYGDLDNDGDLDLVVSNIDETAFIYENNLIGEIQPDSVNYLRVSFEGKSPNRQGIGSKVYLYINGVVQYQLFAPWRGYLSTMEPVLHFGLGNHKQIDSLHIVWPDGKVEKLQNVESNQEITLHYENAAMPNNDHTHDNISKQYISSLSDSIGIEYQHQENLFVDFKLQPTLPHMHSQLGPGVAVGDVNGDGLEDFYTGGAAKVSGKMFIQNENGTFTQQAISTNPAFEEMGVLLFDVENDGDLDLYAVSGGVVFDREKRFYQDQLYVNDGNGNFSSMQGALPEITASGSVVTGNDFDKDGDIDLFVGGRISPGSYPLTPESYLLENKSSENGVSFENVTSEKASGLEKAGMISAALWTDFNNDGWTDLIVVGEFTEIIFYQNNQGSLVNVTAKTNLKNTSGWWNSITGEDFDKDGDIDYVVGNLGLNSYYKASAERPVEIYAADFDDNGRVDPILTHYIGDVKYPVHTRDDLIEQVSAMRGRFKTYLEYAETPFETMFLEEELAKAEVLEVQRFESVYLENTGNGSFKMIKLPIQAQFSPLHGMVAGDFNANGNPEIMIVGNSYASDPNLGNYDALTGVYLEYVNGEFQPVESKKSGFFVDGNARSLAYIETSVNTLFLTMNNQGAIDKHFRGKERNHIEKFPSGAEYALIYYKDGSVAKKENYLGEGYLSQNSSVILLAEDLVEKIEYYNSENEKIAIE